MSAFISVFDKGSDEYEHLQLAAVMLTNRSPNGWFYHVGETYFDYGQGWKWTTILCEGNKFGSYQALNPREQEDIIMASRIDELGSIVEGILADKFCPDKKRKEA